MAKVFKGYHAGLGYVGVSFAPAISLIFPLKSALSLLALRTVRVFLYPLIHHLSSSVTVGKIINNYFAHLSKSQSPHCVSGVAQ